ncbi:diaminobutyrate acetyltransferase [Texcoconibacillus texcoconensis]|uniref:L-2,4-diaminobutyric acid acetyltransferase n=1 Tax=Texcoconibacillus texcoconensis TaxID=1095777 RepID=A0A840QUB1_9BACI|nr:diaminobutyrate acetyltransferase [Texcoconibacillus texcoconensis]MBB5174871.1 L-2,4-diaminobutyric acid acetyltransferase [Texcoconibacillus texcoconensis]
MTQFYSWHEISVKQIKEDVNIRSQVATAPTQTIEKVHFAKPSVEDGAAMWELVEESTLDTNSPYKYIMMCEFFTETCVVAKQNDKVVGFVTAFIPPENKDTVFVWQVGVDSSQRGKGLASKLLNELLNRSACNNVRYLEATVTPSNKASQSLFRRIARDYDTTCAVQECFSEDLFPGDDHEAEMTFRIGPIHK